MSEMKRKIHNFINDIGKSHDTLKFLYNLRNTNFDPEKDSIYYSGPCWDNAEVVALFESVLSGKWLTSGEKVNQFEQAFSRKFGHKMSLMVNSGSSANLIMMSALKKYFSWNNNDEVIVSTVGFPTTVAPIIQCGLKAVFVDINIDDLNFDLNEVEKKIKKNTKAIFISPVLGNAPDMDQLVSISDHYNVPLILDNCDSLGSKWDGKYLSDYTLASSCSFYPAHHITTGEGGMVSSRVKELIALARSYAWWGRDCYCVGQANLLPNGTCKKRFDNWIPGLETIIDHKYLFSNIGYNFKPLDLQGAIGIDQLKKIDRFHKKRIKNKETIDSFFSKNIDGIRLINQHSKADTSWFGVPIVCDTKEIKNNLTAYLENNRIQTRHYFAGNILSHPAYQGLDNALNYPNANEVLSRIFFVGCTPTYSDDMIDYIELVLKNYNNTRSKRV